jgi:hypothetical protein
VQPCCRPPEYGRFARRSHPIKRLAILVSIALLIGLFLAGLAQLIRPAIVDNNPAVVSTPSWPDPQVEALARRACFDCHSNETIWPWYAHVAPVSWFIANDVAEGRQRLNFSDWTARRRETGELSRVVSAGRMPPVYYIWMHADANLTSAERAQLADGFNALH